MNITIVAPYCSLPSEPHFNRFWYLAELLSQSHDVLLITSNFKHYDKSFRRPEDAEAASQGRLKVMLLEESGYSKNVSLGRVPAITASSNILRNGWKTAVRANKMSSFPPIR